MYFIKTILTCLLLGISIFKVIAQQRCIDSVQNQSIYSGKFKDILSPAVPPLLFDLNDSSSLLSLYSRIIKFSKNGLVTWDNEIEKLATLKYQNSDQTSIGLFSFEQVAPAIKERGLVKINEHGERVWSKMIKPRNSSDDLLGLVYSASSGYNDDIVMASVSSQSSKAIDLLVLDSAGANIKIDKRLVFSFRNNEFIQAIRTATDAKYIYMAIISRIDNFPISFTNFLMLIKLDIATGNVVSKNYLRFDDSITLPLFPSVILSFIGNFSSKFYFEFANNELHLSGYKNQYSFDNNRLYAMKIDTSLEIKKQHIYRYPKDFSFRSDAFDISESGLNKTGCVMFSNIRKEANSKAIKDCHFLIIDSGLNIVTQRVQNAIEMGINPHLTNIEVSPLLGKNLDAKLLYYHLGSNSDSGIHFVNVPFNFVPSNCQGSEENLVEIETPTYSKLAAPLVSVDGTLEVSITDYPLQSIKETTVSENFCQQISICDTISISGPSKICNLHQAVTYKLFKNSQCLRKSYWVTDTTAMEILGKPSDTLLTIQFKKPFKGFIKAGFAGCSLVDSIWVEAFSGPGKPNLGADTMLCPGQPILLRADDRYRSYLWSTGSTQPSIGINSSGIYWLLVKDSCNNVFTDSIVVKPFDYQFDLQQTAPLCITDTFSLSLPNALYNYMVTPSGSGIITADNTVKLFPTYSTIYTISGDRFVGCKISDTIKVNVVYCPILLRMPTAFTPNNDGVNDVFKPRVDGRLILYDLQIFDRFGQLIFKSNQPERGWDGKFKNVPQQQGGFVWQCRYQFLGQKESFKKGALLLIR